MSGTSKQPSDEEEEPEGAAYVDRDERGGSFPPGMGVVGMSFDSLPAGLQEQILRRGAAMDLQREVAALISKHEGIVEAQVLPEFTTALQNDYRITNRDALIAQHAAQELLDKAKKVARRPSYWSAVHMLRYVANMLRLEADLQEATAHLQEAKLPGSTSEVADVQLPGAD